LEKADEIASTITSTSATVDPFHSERVWKLSETSPKKDASLLDLALIPHRVAGTCDPGADSVIDRGA
jgi:hypothetical protein